MSSAINQLSEKEMNYQSSPKTDYQRADSTDDESNLDRFSPKIVKTNICKFKTEMCKNYSEMGFCPYRNKCQFAHGAH